MRVSSDFLYCRLGIACASTLLAAGSSGFAQDAVLPHGEARPPIVTAHFPDRVHEFVWRNWSAVEPPRLAKILGASVEDVTAVAESMGLPRDPVVPPEMIQRGYITLIRRNWHLLPYEQLLELVDMTPERLAFALREDDFLWVKLGRVKPKCEPLRYRPPDAAARRRAAEIRRVVQQDFGKEILRPGEPRFDFVRQLSTPPHSAPPPQPHEGLLKLVYSYLAVYGDPLANPDLDPYPDGFLQRLAAVGVNGIWLHAVLRDLAPGGAAFPEFGRESQRRLTNLQSLVKRAARHGIGVYLYLNEPRAMPESFFRTRPELAGVPQEHFRAMCTSQAVVRKWMSDALTYIFSNVPELAGVYAITASENLTNCASLGGWKQCPRCQKRTDAAIIAEVVATLEEGVHRGNPKAKVIVSDWGWRGHGDAREIIRLLPKPVWLMSVSEWSMSIKRGGIESKVGEYAISAVGPGPRAVPHWQTAAERGLKRAAEIQFNNTCEIASIPYLPVLDLIAEHVHNLAPFKLDGMLIGWTMGGHPSPNFQIAQRLTAKPEADPAAALDALARERFGESGGPHARKAWTIMSEGYREYPFHIRVVYNSPVQMGPANPLYASSTGYRATMWGLPYDDLNTWRGPYPGEVFAAQFQKMAEAWQPGIQGLKTAVERAPAARRQEVRADLLYARAAAIHFQSVANQARFIIARNALQTATSAEDERRLRAEIKRRLESEIALARELFDLVREDSRIGFEPSCHYFYLPLDLVEKVINCRWLLRHFAS